MGPWKEQILVPFCWESLAAWGQGDSAGNDHYYATRIFRDPSRVDRTNHRTAPRYEVGWYRREIQIPLGAPDWAGKRVILTVGAADFFTDGWCNGQPLGRHEGGYTPFEFDLTDALDVDGRGVIVLRVEDPMDNAQQPVGKQWQWYTTTSGIWQTVFVEPRHATYLQPFRITPDIDAATATFDLPCADAREGDDIAITIRPPGGGEAYTQTVAISGGRAMAILSVRPLMLWDHHHPHLYQVDLRLRRSGEVLDKVHTYFGMRKIGAQASADDGPAALALNGRTLYLRGALHQSFYPEGVYTAGDARTLREDIAYAKKAGFDFLRIHIKIDDPLLLYYADTVGMLLMTDFPNFGEGGDTLLGRTRFEAMMRAAIERDFNHPSIIAWCMFNETWGFGGQVELMKWMEERKLVERPATEAGKEEPPAPAASGQDGGQTQDPAAQPAAPFKIHNEDAHKWVQEMWRAAKALDATRLIEDMSVVYWDHLDYYAHVETDINSWHFYINDYEKARAHIDKVARDTYSGSRFNYVPGFEQGNAPLITSEYGGVGALDGDRDISWSFKFLTNELRRQPKLSAYVFTQLHDVEWEYNGFLNYDRTAKEFGYDPTIINAGDVLAVDAAPVRRAAPGERVRVEVSVSHYSARLYDNVVLQWRLSGTDELGRIHADLARGGGPIPFPERRVVPVATVECVLPETTMLCKLLLRAVDAADGSVLAENYVEFFVSSQPPPSRELRPDGSESLRGAPGDWSAAQWEHGFGERQEATAEDSFHGQGSGFVEWSLPVENTGWRNARRLRVLCEASSCRPDTPQTSLDLYPSTLRILLNGVLVHTCAIPDHPHDARGVLSYLRGAPGAYGYLEQVVIEGDLLRRVREAMGDGHLRMRLEVPPDVPARNGLTLYGPECGRYPVGPCVVVEG